MAPSMVVSFGLVVVISTDLLGWNCLGCRSAAAILSPLVPKQRSN